MIFDHQIGHHMSSLMSLTYNKIKKVIAFLLRFVSFAFFSSFSSPNDAITLLR